MVLCWAPFKEKKRKNTVAGQPKQRSSPPFWGWNSDQLLLTGREWWVLRAQDHLSEPGLPSAVQEIEGHASTSPQLSSMKWNPQLSIIQPTGRTCVCLTSKPNHSKPQLWALRGSPQLLLPSQHVQAPGRGSCLDWVSFYPHSNSMR